MHRILPILLICTLHCGAPPPEPATPPNILFAIADDASFPHMGAYGTTWVSTPAFDRVAREGLLFTRAYTPNAKCAPSRAAILTGRNSWQLEEAANHWAFFPPKFKTYVEALRENGYFAGYTLKGWSPGIALDEAGNRRELTGQAFNERQLTPPAEFIATNDYAGNFESFLEARPEGQPFAFWYGSIEPHRAYEFGASARVGKKLEDIDSVPAFWPDNDSVRIDMLDYAFELEYFDQHLQRMLDLLETHGELENTIVVVTADNGMPFPRVKGQSYEYSNHLPLAIMWPAGIRNPGRTIEDFVSFIDFAPTFLDLAGLDPGAAGMQPITGRSLSPVFADRSAGPHREHVLIGKERHDIGRPLDAGYPIRGIVKDDMLYIRNFETDRWPAGNPETGYLNCDGSPTKTVCLDARSSENTHSYWQLSFGKRPAEELYHIGNDPECLHNLAADPQYAAIKADLLQLMTDELTAQADPRILGNGHIFDEYTYADDRQRGFYERYMGGEEMNAGWVNESDFRDVGMWGCGDVGMWGCGDVGMWGCGDVGMWGCGDVGMWGCGDVGEK